jgi:hypothetical protein
MYRMAFVTATIDEGDVAGGLVNIPTALIISNGRNVPTPGAPS